MNATLHVAQNIKERKRALIEGRRGMRYALNQQGARVVKEIFGWRDEGNCGIAAWSWWLDVAASCNLVLMRNLTTAGAGVTV